MIKHLYKINISGLDEPIYVTGNSNQEAYENLKKYLKETHGWTYDPNLDGYNPFKIVKYWDDAEGVIL